MLSWCVDFESNLDWDRYVVRTAVRFG